MMSIEEFLKAHEELPTIDNCEVKVLVNQRAMAETVLRSKITDDEKIIGALEFLANSIYANVWKNAEDMKPRAEEGYFNFDYKEAFYRMAEESRNIQDGAPSAASVIASALSAYTNRQEFDMCWESFIYGVHELGIDLGIFHESLKSNIKFFCPSRYLSSSKG